MAESPEFCDVTNVDRQRPKVLYLTFDAGFVNPTRQLLCDVLREVAEVAFYGPGYLSMETLGRGIDDYVSQNGPYDFVVADEAAIEDYSCLDRGEEIRFRIHACRFDPKLLRMGRDYQEFLRTYDGTRLIALCQTDYYNFSTQRIDALESLGDFYLAWGEEFFEPRSQLDLSDMSPTGLNRMIYDQCNDRYLDFVKRNPRKIVSFPHFIAEAELDTTRLAKRSFEWSVLGADYDARVAAREALDHAGFRRSGGWLNYVYAVAHKLRLNLYNKYSTIAFIQWGFFRALRQAKYGFTCGSLVNLPIRKIFEIPASGSVLVCDRPNGFGALGFTDKENAILCRGKDILDAHDWLSADDDRAQAVADAGRALVQRQHSVGARARQVAAALQRIRTGNYAGSRWHEGVFELKES